MNIVDVLFSKPFIGEGGTTPTGQISISENGTYDVTNYASALVNVAGGGGGGGNIVMGTFTTKASGYETISIPYSGAGYPIAFLIFPHGGGMASAWSSLVSINAVGVIGVVKYDMSTTPQYHKSGDMDLGTGSAIYKDSSTISSSYAAEYNNGEYTYTAYSRNTATGCVAFVSPTSLDYSIKTASAKGLAPSFTYDYIIIYSS